MEPKGRSALDDESSDQTQKLVQVCVYVYVYVCVCVKSTFLQPMPTAPKPPSLSSDKSSNSPDFGAQMTPLGSVSNAFK
jgi:hypothetical protein